MRNKWIFAFLVLIMAAGCGSPGYDPQTPEPDETENEVLHTPTSSPTPTEVTATLVEPTPTQTVSTPEIESTEVPEPPLPVVYADRTVDPPDVVFIDPLDGTEIRRISAPELGFGGTARVTENSIFYFDNEYRTVYRLLFDGTLEPLEFLNPEDEYLDGEILPSPDGSRIAFGAVLSYDPSGDQVQLKVVNVDGTEEQILFDDVLTDMLTRPTPIKWSADGQYLFYMNVIVGVEGFGGTDLHRVAVDTGSSEIIFTDRRCLCATSISPDDSIAVRVLTEEPLILSIKNLATGTERTLSLPSMYRQAWQMVWAPDSSALLVTLGLGDWENDAYSVVRIEPETLEMTFLISEDDRLLRSMAWHVMETIWLNDRDGNLWLLEADSLALSLVKPSAWVIPTSR